MFFRSGCTSLRSHQQWIRIPFSPPPRQHLLLLVLLMKGILTGVRWNLSVVLIYICRKHLNLIYVLKLLVVSMMNFIDFTWALVL
jgi:hypothetical protein